MRKRILIIDDVPDWRNMLYEILEKEYEVVTVGTYEAARGIIRNRETELAIVDLRLSPSDENNREGMELLKELAECRINAIVLTGYPEQEIQVEAEEKYNAFDFIDKSAVAGNMRLIRDVIKEAFSLLENKQKAKEQAVKDTSRGQSIPFSPDLASWPLRRFRKGK